MQVVYLSHIDTYPATAAMVLCNEDDSLSGILQSLNEEFEEYAVLSDVLKATCKKFGLGEKFGPMDLIG